MNETQNIPSFSLTPDWIAWLDLNVARGVSRPSLAEAMTREGCDPGLARGLAEAWECGLENRIASASPMPPERSTRLAKIRWLLGSLRSLQAERPADALVERDAIDAEEFHLRFYPANLPVIYRDCLSPASLAEALAFERLDSEFGGREVEIQEGRSSESDFERKSDSLKSAARFGDFLRRVRDATDSNDFYMTANNASSNASLLEAAFDPASLCPELLDGSKAQGQVFLWVGPRGTFTPAHHDLTNNLFLQVHGSKEFRLASSLALLELDNDRHCYLASSLSENDERRRAAGLPPLSFTVTLEAGDILFIPLGWWHEVRGLSPSVSVSATNFRGRNDFYRDYDFFGRLEA